MAIRPFSSFTATNVENQKMDYTLDCRVHTKDSSHKVVALCGDLADNYWLVVFGRLNP